MEALRSVRLSAPMLTLCLLLSACGGAPCSQAEEQGLALRTEYLALEGCTVHADVTADYGQRVCEYGLDLCWRPEGESVLTVTSPEELAGMRAVLRPGGSSLEFDGVQVETGTLDGRGLTPLEAVPALLSAMREGFLARCALEETEDGTPLLHTVIRTLDADQDRRMEYQLWFHADTHALLAGEISVEDFTVIRCLFRDFQLLGTASP